MTHYGLDFLYLYKYIRQWQMKIGILKNVLCDPFITNSCLCGIETKKKSDIHSSSTPYNKGSSGIVTGALDGPFKLI